LLFLLSGCRVSPDSNKDHTLPDSEESPGLSGSAVEEPSAIEALRIKGTVIEYLPELTFVFEKPAGPAGEMDADIVYRVTITCEDEPDFIFQTFRLKAAPDLSVGFADIDCNGFRDMEIANNGVGARKELRYYRWDERADLYEESAFLCMSADEYEALSDTKQVIATLRDGVSSYTRNMYQLADGEYVRTRSENVTCETKDGMLRYSVTTSNVFAETPTVLFTDTFSENDFFASNEIRNCYLKYGVDHAKSPEEISELLYDRFGEYAMSMGEAGIFLNTETGYPLAFAFEKMVPEDGISCYSFRMSWLVDNSHWSWLSDVVVTPNGDILGGWIFPG
jgi:hypothetical protein